jgi:hypothetical protein
MCRRGSSVAGVLVVLAFGGGVVVAAAAIRHVTRSQAPAIVAAINLRHSDLPDLSQGPASTPAELQADNQANAEMARCYGGPAYSLVLASAASRLYGSASDGGTAIISETEIFPSTALASKDLATGGGPAGQACEIAGWRGVFSAKVPPASIVAQVSAITSVVAGTGMSVAIRMSFARRSGTTTHALAVVDLFGFVRGQVETTLELQTGGSIPSATTERRLARLLVARARAAIG